MAEQKRRVLVVDDEEFNLKLITRDLQNNGFETVIAKDGKIALDTLKEDANFDVILLDRMMPNMNGMELMEKIKSDPDICDIPVIMQTAAAAKEQVMEGIKAGVYYYLIKPYDLNVMLSIVNAAVVDYSNYSRLRNDLKRFSRKLKLVKQAIFEIQTLDDVQYLATFLSQFFPCPEKVVFGLSELMVNAVEHGNLGITYEEKTELNKQRKWEEEICRRISLPEYKNKYATISFSRNNDNITVSIKDEGSGFDWHDYTDISPDRAIDNHGRGIALSKLMSFQSIEYKGCGNEVICTVPLEP